MTTVHPGPVSGTVRAPASKSVAHRAIIASALADGTSTIEGMTWSADVRATLAALAALGARPAVSGDRVTVTGIHAAASGAAARGTGAPGERQEGSAPAVLDCGESGSTLRFLIPVALALGNPVCFTGRGKLPERPLGPYRSIFEAKGIRWEEPGKGCSLPLRLSGRLVPGTYVLPGDVSSQFVSGLLFALPLLPGPSEIVLSSELESRAYVDLTLKVLADFGVPVERDGYRSFSTPGGARFAARNVGIEGDYSQAAVLVAAGLIAGDVTVTGLDPASVQPDRAIIGLARHMGGRIEAVDKGGLPVAESGTGAGRAAGYRVRKSTLSGIDIDASQSPDIVPILAVLATQATGTTRICNAGRLRIKESDRLAATAGALGALGADITETADGLEIRGGRQLAGGESDGWNDHRIVMALATAALAASGPVRIRGAEAVAKSWPGFFGDLGSLGARIDGAPELESETK